MKTITTTTGKKYTVVKNDRALVPTTMQMIDDACLFIYMTTK